MTTHQKTAGAAMRIKAVKVRGGVASSCAEEMTTPLIRKSSPSPARTAARRPTPDATADWDKIRPAFPDRPCDATQSRRPQSAIGRVTNATADSHRFSGSSNESARRIAALA